MGDTTSDLELERLRIGARCVTVLHLTTQAGRVATVLSFGVPAFFLHRMVRDLSGRSTDVHVAMNLAATLALTGLGLTAWRARTKLRRQSAELERLRRYVDRLERELRLRDDGAPGGTR